ncbi:hypothetical protein LZQ00_07495 [Sphingobacterium sp. SRCM116780]|uniref:hypothetical protein n=1 Tax=Sphingobacterium sp. SRCM116780 TaxID=2907623 RepID=UPI001F3DBF17|nr:hypothetical protein [Sphingobacterium sp. SRCM116780]UIR57655.1 hypothetical protein LZQ00_07495 [Sphingobacterium sp. SRCM116780]
MIVPNLAYQQVPAMEKDEAALRILKLLLSTSNYSKPWWSFLPITLGFFSRKIWDRF